jgi:putative hemolysin
MWITIGIIFFLLLSALFSGTEIAFISASKLLVELKKNKGSRRGAIIARFYESPSEFLGTMLVGNNLALVFFTALITVPLTYFLQTQLGWKSDLLLLVVNNILITIIVLIFGEFLPKTLFRLYADTVLYFLAYPLVVMKFLLAMPAWMMTRLSNFLLGTFLRSPVEEINEVFTRLDLENFIKSTRTDSDEEIDTELFEKALNLREVRVKECMVPRTEIEFIEVTDSVDSLISKFQETNLSRIIVIDNDIDEVLGYIHHQQLLTGSQVVKEMLLEIPIIPESMRVRDVLNRFIMHRWNIVCVVDEFGGTAGILTLEDVLEEIFGEIEDEHDSEEHVEQQIAEGEYLFSGRLEIDYLNEKYTELEFPEGEYHTLSGYLVMTTTKIPEQGAEIILNRYKFILDQVSDTKIETVRVIVLPEHDLPNDQGE